MNAPLPIAPSAASTLGGFAQADGSRVPYGVFTSQAVYDQEQARIFRGPTWSFLGLEAEIKQPGDFKSTFIGDTPVVMTRTEDGGLAAWVNRCAHRGAMVCRQLRGNAMSHSCVYHQWRYDLEGNLYGVPFLRGLNGQAGMPADFDRKANGLRKLRVESYAGLVFASFSETVEPLADYIGPVMGGYIDRIFHKPVEYLGCTRQYSNSNWKLYLENVKDPYHASLLHLFHTTFNIFRVGMKAHCVAGGAHGLHSIIMAIKAEQTETAAAYKDQKIRSFDSGFTLEDESILALIPEYEVLATNHIQPIFPQLVIQQIHNTLVARQLLPKGPDHFELVFHFFGYEDDTPEMRKLRIKQANLVGPAGYISMEDTEATELVQQGVVRDAAVTSVIDMAKDAPDQSDTLITEKLIRSFWSGYQALMGPGIADLARGLTPMADLDLRQALLALQDEYISTLDTDALERWPEMFVDDCLYEIIPKENVDLGLPAPVIYCDSKAMLRDRVISLRNANIYQPVIYRHFFSGLSVQMTDDGVVEMQSSYLVINTSQLGQSVVYQTGRYNDVVVQIEGRWLFKSKRAIYDTSRIQTALAIPI